MERPALFIPRMTFGLRLVAALQLMRPANALTAAADVIAGIAVAWRLGPNGLAQDLWLLPLSAFLLYAGGVALNDVCDAELDSHERPERPIPQGRISQRAGLWWSALLLAAGVFAATAYGNAASVIAAVLVLFIVSYDTYAKHLHWLGPVNMGLCRMCSLLLGISAAPVALGMAWPLAVIPFVYVAAITLVSRGEADGRNPYGMWALALVTVVAATYAALSVALNHWIVTIFAALFILLVWPAFYQAAIKPTPDTIRGAVMAGVLNIIVCDAAITAAFAGVVAGLLVLLMLPLSRAMARLFPVA